MDMKIRRKLEDIAMPKQVISAAALSHLVIVPARSIEGKVLGIDQRRDILCMTLIKDNGVEADMSAGDIWFAQGVLTRKWRWFVNMWKLRIGGIGIGDTNIFCLCR